MNHACPSVHSSVHNWNIAMAIEIFKPKKVTDMNFPDEGLFDLKWTKKAQNEPKIEFFFCFRIISSLPFDGGNWKWKAFQVPVSCANFAKTLWFSQIWDYLIVNISRSNAWHVYPWYVAFRFAPWKGNTRIMPKFG